MGDGGYTRNRTAVVLLKGRVLSQDLGLPLKKKKKKKWLPSTINFVFIFQAHSHTLVSGIK